MKLTKEVSGINQEFEKLKIDSIPALKLSTYEVERRIKQNYFSDTINLEFGQNMDDYKRMRRMLDPIGKEEFRLHQSINEELSQLKKLHSTFQMPTVNGSLMMSIFNSRKIRFLK